MRLKPLHDWVLIRRKEPQEKTAAGIIIPESAKDKPLEGAVEAIGPGRYKTEPGKKEKKFVPTVLRPGQRVIFVEYAARDFEIGGKQMTLIREADILGTVEGEPQVKESPSAVEEKERLPALPEKAVSGELYLAKEPTPVAKKTAVSPGGRKPAAKKTAVKKKTPGKSAVKASGKTVSEKTAKKAVKKATTAKKKEAPAKKAKALPAKKVAKKAVSKKAGPKKAAPKKATLKKTQAKKTVSAKTAKKGVSKAKKRPAK